MITLHHRPGLYILTANCFITTSRSTGQCANESQWLACEFDLAIQVLYLRCSAELEQVQAAHSTFSYVQYIMILTHSHDDIPLIITSHSKKVAQLWQRDRASSINDLRWRVNLRLNYRLKGYFSHHCDITQFTLMHHMVIKPFLLLGLAAEYRCRRWMR